MFTGGCDAGPQHCSGRKPAPARLGLPWRRAMPRGIPFLPPWSGAGGCNRVGDPLGCLG